ncbi:MAG: hypothetical protein P4L90_00320 [Rhodopila sp.]|nr:hypothetical protein [Rhodopila sp.]
MSEAASAERMKTKAAPPAQSADQAPDPSNRVAELQVSAHLMTLETGLFCVFQTPGSPLPDQATGLPGVRITPAPGIAGRPEAVSVSTFREDGWLNGTAALVRVTDGSAQILVTIYQQRGQDAAPRLQVLRLSGEPTAPAGPETQAVPAPPRAPAQTAAPAEAAPKPEIMAHIQRTGDVGCMIGDWLGVKGSRQWVEGFGLAPAKGIALQDIEYQAVLGRNWLSPWVEGGKFCGSRGMALPLLGFKVRLKGAAAKAFECSYAATFVDGSAIGPVGGGEPCEAESLAALESFQIVIKPRGGKAAGDKVAVGKPAAKAPAAKPTPKSAARPRARA